MSGFLTRLSQRLVASDAVVRPKAPALFAAETAVGDASDAAGLDEPVAEGGSWSQRPPGADRRHARMQPESAGEALPGVRRSLSTESARYSPMHESFENELSQSAPRIPTPHADAGAEVVAAAARSGAAEHSDSRLRSRAEATVEEAASEPNPTVDSRSIDTRSAIAARAVSPPFTTRPEAEQSSPEAPRPVVHVTIGRIEVRAPAAPAPVERKPAAPRARLTIGLDEYLGGTRRG